MDVKFILPDNGQVYLAPNDNGSPAPRHAMPVEDMGSGLFKCVVWHYHLRQFSWNLFTMLELRGPLPDVNKCWFIKRYNERGLML